MNPNTFYAETFVDALARAGLDAVCIAPGSRSTPLTLAFAKHEGIKKYTHLDERSAAFFALGMAMANDKPVAMVCTSGTAAANFFPAIIEANMSRVPLLVLTADRPHELRHSGANQTIDQVKLYGDHVLWSVDMALPEANPPQVAVRNLRTMAVRAFATADGRMEFRRKGVVHLNFPFRKPLEPELQVHNTYTEPDEEVIAQYILPVVHIAAATTRLSALKIEWLTDLLQRYRRGVIVCGRGLDFRSADAIRGLSAQLGYPNFADVLSNVRYGYFFDGMSHYPLGSYETYLNSKEVDELSPDVILRFGGEPVSKWLNTYIAKARPKHHIQFAPDGSWSNSDHNITDHFESNISDIHDVIAYGGVLYDRDTDWIGSFIHRENISRNVISSSVRESFFDGFVVAEAFNCLPPESYVFAGNSNAVRHIDQFALGTDKRLNVLASRGASGIDGQVSTALGIGAATQSHVYVILGDITFYHDMNGLLAVQRNGITATFIVINNNGGGIFERLPIREHDPHYTEYFTTPHGLTFEHAAAMYGLEYAFADDFDSLDAALDKYINADVSSIIEVKTDIKTDEARRKEIIELVNQQIRQSLSDNE